MSHLPTVACRKESGLLHRLRLMIAVCALLATALPCSRAMAELHYAPNGNFDSTGRFAPGAFGFNMSDVRKVSDLALLPAGVLALVWVGQCNGADARFVATVAPFIGHPKVFGFYLMDDPDPAWWRGRSCSAVHLKAEADWLHVHMPKAKTFIMLMNLGSGSHPSFAGSYNPANTHVDLFGLSPYPCRTEFDGCDLDMIQRFVVAASVAGIPADRIIPTYQTFGGGRWIDDGGGRYLLPSVVHERDILARWSTLIGRPVFDYSYSWASQRGDSALENSPELRAVLAEHNIGCASGHCSTPFGRVP